MRPPVRTIVAVGAIGHSMASYVTLAKQLLSSTLPKSKTQAEIEDTMATTHFLRMATSGFDGNVGSRVGRAYAKQRISFAAVRLKYFVLSDVADFTRCFRVPPDLFMKLQRFVVHHNIKKKDCNFRNTTPADIITGIVLRRLAVGISFFDLGRDFGVGEETARVKCQEFYAVFSRVMLKRVVKLPRGEELKKVMHEFYQTRGLPNCCFALDGTHVPWRCSEIDKNEFKCYKTFTSINVQLASCKAGMIRSCTVGAAGGVCDATVFAHSGFSKILDSKKWPDLPPVMVRGVMVPPYGVADGIYPAKPHLVKPYRGASHKLSRTQRNFNFCQSSTRQPIEHVNGILKRRFRILCKANEVWKKRDAVNTILACIILNNLLTLRGNYDHNPFSDDEDSDADEFEGCSDDEQTEDCLNIRDALAAHLAGLAV